MQLQRPLWQMRRQRLLQDFTAGAHQGVDTLAHDLDFGLLLRLQMQGGMKRSVDLGLVEQESVLGLLSTVQQTRAGRCQNSPCCGDASWLEQRLKCDSVLLNLRRTARYFSTLTSSLRMRLPLATACLGYLMAIATASSSSTPSMTSGTMPEFCSADWKCQRRKIPMRGLHD